MRSRWSTRWVAALGLAMVLAPSGVGAQEAGGSVLKRGAIAEDLYVAGGMVDILAEVEGDVVTAGGRVTIGRLVKGDVIAAGGEVTVGGEVLDDVRAAGGLVIINARIGGDAIAAGGSVSLPPETRVNGNAWLAGADVEVRGRIAKHLKVAARTVRIAGQVLGDVTLVAKEIEILPTARIAGDLTYRSPGEAKVDPAAQIGGTVTRQPIGLWGAAPIPAAMFRIVRVLFWLSLMVAGLALFLLFPKSTVNAARTIERDPWRSLGLGFALLVATPLLAGFLLISIVGIPLGLAILALYLVSLLVGFLTAALFLGDLGARLFRREVSKGWGAFLLVAAIIVLALLGTIPFAGGGILFLALLLGLGAWGLHGYRTYVSARPEAGPTG